METASRKYVLTAPDDSTWRLDLGGDAVCWCYYLGANVRYASSLQANDLLMRLYRSEDGEVSCLLSGETRENEGRKPNLLPAVARLIFAAVERQQAKDAAKEEVVPAKKETLYAATG